jgi:hypothetical protein
MLYPKWCQAVPFSRILQKSPFLPVNLSAQQCFFGRSGDFWQTGFVHKNRLLNKVIGQSCCCLNYVVYPNGGYERQHSTPVKNRIFFNLSIYA